MNDELDERQRYEPPTIEDLGTLEELTQSGNNLPPSDVGLFT